MTLTDDEFRKIDEQQIADCLDKATETYLEGVLNAAEQMRVEGEIRGLSVALSILRGTSGMEEAVDSERRLGKYGALGEDITTDQMAAKP